MLYRQVKKTTGEFIQDVIFDGEPQLNDEFEFVSVEPPSGIYKHIWKNGKWMEGLSPAEIQAKKDSFTQPKLKDFKTMSTGEKDALLEEIAKRMGLIENGKVVLP